jgi:hypothetical protein
MGRSARRGQSLASTLVVTSIGAVLVLVSVTQLHDFAVRGNEEDALAAVRLIARTLPASSDPLPVLRIGERLEGPELAHQLADADLLADGRLLRRHGYLFEILALPLPRVDEPGAVHAAGAELALAVRAWPWEVGRTGSAVFIGVADGRVFGHRNEVQAWSGTSRAVSPVLDQSGWVLVP